MSYEPPCKDIIPGTSSFLYEANRFREDYEYIGYWKIVREARIRAEEGEIKDLSLFGLIDQITKASTLLEEGNKSYRFLEEQWELLDKRHRFLEHDCSKLKSKLEIQQPQIVHLEEQLTLWMDVTMDYGEHLDDCGWMEILNSARVVNAKEEEYCTCEWYKKRMDLKTDPRFKGSRPPEEMKVKEKKNKFKIDLDI